MTEILAIALLVSNLAMLTGIYIQSRARVVTAAMAPDPEVSDRPMKDCVFCDEPVSKAARKCPWCTANLPV